MSKWLKCHLETRYDSRDGHVYEQRVVAKCRACRHSDRTPWLPGEAYDLLIGPPEFRALVKRHEACNELHQGRLSLVGPGPFGTLAIAELGSGALSIT